MKTNVTTSALKTFIIFLGVVGLQVSTVNAGSLKGMPAPKAVFVVTSLAPSVPAVADFSDMPLVISEIYSTLQPVAPKEASFDDSGMEAYAALNLVNKFRPEIPGEAGFDD